MKSGLFSVWTFVKDLNKWSAGKTVWGMIPQARFVLLRQHEGLM